jgi:hypothetical protein
MKRKEMIETIVIYCDWCGEKITDYAHTSVMEEGNIEKDFHCWDKKCIDEYTKQKHDERLKNRKLVKK